MDVQIKIKNMDEFKAAIAKSPAIIGRRLQRGIERATESFLAATKQNIRTGREMWKPPIDTGFMWNNIFTSVFPLRSHIFATADYAVYVHEGTTRMRARPFFDITANSEASNIDKIFTQELQNAMQEVATNAS